MTDNYGSTGLEYGMTDEGYAVIGIGSCKEKEIVIPSENDGLPVEKIGEGAFERRRGITGIVIPDSVKIIGSASFRGCTNLRNVRMGDGVIRIHPHAFDRCTSLESVRISGKENFIGDYSFSGCTNLKSIVICDGVSSICEGAFWGCVSLESVIVPDSVDYIGIAAFAKCSGLKSVYLGKGMFDIDNDAFSGCCSLIEITIPESTDLLGVGIFDDCYSLKRIYYGGTKRNWEVTCETSGVFQEDIPWTATVYFYCKDTPPKRGHFWHYGEDGKPVVWRK